MTTLAPLTGIIPIVVTPFDGQDRVDYLSLERLLDDYCRHEVSGVMVPAVASEVDKLTTRERAEIVRETVRVVEDRIPVYGGILGDSSREAAKLTEQALGAGCRGILCRAPEKMASEPDALKSYFHEVASTGAEEIVIQDLSWTDFGIATQLIVELFHLIPAFRTTKIEVLRTGYKATRLFEQTNGELHVWSGWAMLQMIESLERGIQGFCPSAFNRPFVRIFNLYHGEDRSQAIRLFHTVLPYLAWSRQHLDINLHLLKRFCVAKGLFQSAALRAPYVEYDRFHEQHGQKLIEQMIEWEQLSRAIEVLQAYSSRVSKSSTQVCFLVGNRLNDPRHFVAVVEFARALVTSAK